MDLTACSRRGLIGVLLSHSSIDETIRDLRSGQSRFAAKNVLLALAEIWVVKVGIEPDAQRSCAGIRLRTGSFAPVSRDSSSRYQLTSGWWRLDRVVLVDSMQLAYHWSWSFKPRCLAFCRASQATVAIQADTARARLDRVWIVLCGLKHQALKSEPFAVVARHSRPPAAL